jgi:DNA-binding IclR family transcriptional regulator
MDFVRQDSELGHFQLGPRVFELGLLYSSRERLVSIALPYMRRLADRSKETVKLAKLSGNELVVLEAIESPYQLHTRGDVGRRAPLHCTGLGKALLASLSRPEAKELLARTGLPRFTPRTITSLARMEREIVQARRDGYALDREENEPGVVCLGVPILSSGVEAAGALSVSGPATRLTEDFLRQYAAILLRAARDISERLGQCDTRARTLDPR